MSWGKCRVVFEHVAGSALSAAMTDHGFRAAVSTSTQV